MVAANSNAVQVLDGFKPGKDLTESQQSKLEEFSKYRSIQTDRDTEMPPYFREQDADNDIVAIHDVRSGLTGVIHRQLVGSEDLGDGKTARHYRIVGWKACSRSEALETVWAPQRAKAQSELGDLVTGEEPF